MDEFTAIMDLIEAVNEECVTVTIKKAATRKNIVRIDLEVDGHHETLNVNADGLNVYGDETFDRRLRDRIRERAEKLICDMQEKTDA